MDTLANALISLKNADIRNKEECKIPASKLIGAAFKILQAEGYIGKFKFIEDGKAGIYEVELLGKINSCGVIKPRLSVSCKELTNLEKRYLPARGMGRVIISTPAGLLTTTEAREKKIGGKLLAFVY